MLHIIKNTAGKYDVVNIAKNGNQLTHTHQGFNRWGGAIKNIRAQLKSFGKVPVLFIIQDDSTPRSKMYRVTPGKLELLPNRKPQKRYRPKN